MTLSPVKKWTFPVIINSKKEPLTADDYHAALMSTSTGFYPVSVTNLMHMGIHFDKTVLKELGDENERKVHCIADGEVVAYRINGNYQNISYGDTVAYYSTGFVLVRHLLEMERVEEKKQPTESNTENSSTTEKPAEDNSPASSDSKANDTATSTNSTADKAGTTSETNQPKLKKKSCRRINSIFIAFICIWPILLFMIKILKRQHLHFGNKIFIVFYLTIKN